MIKRTIESNPSNIYLNVALIGFVGLPESELKVEAWWMDNSFKKKLLLLLYCWRKSDEFFECNKVGCEVCSERNRVLVHYMDDMGM